MFLIFLPLILCAYLVVALAVFRQRFPENPRKVWAVAVVSGVAIFAGDHFAGYSYAYLWVRAVPNPPTLPIVSDSIALESDINHIRRIYEGKIPPSWESDALAMHAQTMVDAEFWQAKGGRSAGLLASYATAQVVTIGASGRKVFDFKVVADENNRGCQTFFTFPQKVQTQWLGNVQKQWNTFIPLGLENGDRARCMSITLTDQLNARHLFRNMRLELYLLERMIGLSEKGSLSISEVASGRVIVESRSLVFWGGWVQRIFTWDPFSNKSLNFFVATPGPKPALRPASPQRVF